MAAEESYAAQLRAALRNHNWKIRDLERRLKDSDQGYSYEHIRKVCGGMPVMSEHFNHAVCDLLGMDKAAMWQVALRAKAQSGSKSAIIASSMAASAPTPELRALWAELTAEDQARARRYIEALADQRRIERLETTSDDPDAIRDQILRLTERLVNTAAGRRDNRQPQRGRDEDERQTTKARVAGNR